MVSLFALFGYFASQIHLEEDINKLMPSSRNEDGTIKLAFADLKIKDGVFVLFDGADQQQLIAACDDFADSLQQDTAQIKNLFYKIDEELMPEAVDYMTAHFPAYIDTTAYAHFDSLLTREHIAKQMLQNREDLQGEFGEMFPELIELDPIGMRNVLAEQLGSLLGGAGSYTTVDNHFFVPDSTVCLLFLTPQYSSTNTGQGSALFERLNTVISQFQQSHPDVHISYHGAPAVGYYNSTQIKHDLATTIAGALVLVLVFLLFCFRRWDFIPLLLLPVVFGTLFGLSMMYWLKGEFSILALGIGGIVLGVALNYVLHVLTHHQYVSDPEELLRHQVKPVLLGCITTIGSFSGLLFVHTDLLRDFGLFAGFAILGATLFSLIWLPQMLNGEGSAFPQFIERINAYSFDRNKPLIAVIVVLTVIGVGAYLIGGTHFDANMENLGYNKPMVKQSEDLLRDKTYTGDNTKYMASKGQTMEEALHHFGLLRAKLDSLQRVGLVKSYSPTDELLVSLDRQQQRIDAWHRYWDDSRLATVRQLIAATAPAADLEPDAFETFFEAAKADYEPEALYKAGLIPQGFLSTLMEQSYDGTWLCFTSVRFQNEAGRNADSDYMRICDAVSSDPHLLVLDTYYYTTETLLQMSSDFDRLQWLSMAFVLVVLWLSFRFNIGHTLLGFMPILLSWLIVLGAMNIFGQQFNLISIIISTFIFGIGVDYSIFIMHGLTNQAQPQIVNSQLSILNYHKTAILLSAVTLLVTVGSMLLAVHPAIRSVGFSTLVGLLAAIILSYVLQPAIYRWLHHKS
ncbi:MAG: MMPL family transporter [Prevotella sp.]|nr:MMPL family transporter [Prevotella sp.]